MLDGTPLRHCIATLHYQRPGNGPPTQRDCGIVGWCVNARSFLRRTGARLIVATNAPATVVQYCHNATLLPAEVRPERGFLDRAAIKWEFMAPGLLRRTGCDLLTYVDSDVDLGTDSLDGPAFEHYASAVTHIAESPARFFAHSDHIVPVNGGVWSAKPSAEMYALGRRVLQDGLEAWTPANLTRAAVANGATPAQLRHLLPTHMFRNNYVVPTRRPLSHRLHGPSDQGLASLVCGVLRPRWCVYLPDMPPRGVWARHHWGPLKPWWSRDNARRCPFYFRHFTTNDSAPTKVRRARPSALWCERRLARLGRVARDDNGCAAASDVAECVSRCDKFGTVVRIV